jgi:hypothetical protein
VPDQLTDQADPGRELAITSVHQVKRLPDLCFRAINLQSVLCDKAVYGRLGVSAVKTTHLPLTVLRHFF